MFHLMPSMIKADHCCPNYIVRQLDEKTPLVERMREQCVEVPERGLYWTRRRLTAAHSDVTRAFEYTVNPPESFVLVVSTLKGITCAFQSSFYMTGSY